MKERTRISLVAVIITLCALAGSAFAAGTPAGTVISNFAIVNYKDANGNSLPQVTSNTVEVTVSQVAGVTEGPSTATQSAVMGQTAVYPITLTNTGNESDTFTLNLNTGQLPSGWTAVVYKDLNGDGVLQANEIAAGPVTTTGSVAADSTYKLLVAVTPPSSGVPDGTSASVTLTATSTFNPNTTYTATQTATLTAAAIYAEKTPSVSSAQPGAVITYTITGGNRGTGSAFSAAIVDSIPANTTYIANSVTVNGSAQGDASGDGDSTTYSAGAIRVQLGTAPATLSTATITFRVRVNANVPSGTTILNTVYVNYQSPLGNNQPPVSSNTARVTVTAKPAVLVQPDSMHTSQQTGDVNLHPFTITNLGNSIDVFDVTSFGRYWIWETWRDLGNNGIIDDGDYLLTDTDSDGTLDTGTIAPGTSHSFISKTVVPAGSPDGQMGLHIITAKSSVDTSVKGTSKKTTSVHAPSMTLTKSVTPTGNQPPGTVLTYSVSYVNTGSGTATSVVIVDRIPDNTAFVDNSIYIDGIHQTDAADQDYAKFDSGSVVLVFPTLAPSGSGTLTFQVRIR